MIEDAFEWCQSEFDERVTENMARQRLHEEAARKRVYDNMLPTYRKALVNVFVDEMLWFYAMKKDRIYLSVKNTVSSLKLLDDYDNKEAWKSAVNKRKFLFDRILKEFDPPELSEPEESQTEEQQHTVSNVNNSQGCGGSGGVNVNLASPSEQVTLRTKDELLRARR